MAKSKVYFADFRVKDVNSDNLLNKLRRLMKRAGFEKIDFTDRFAALKIHFGEPGNLSYLRPNYAKAVADYVKELGGKPFLTDCNTLYVGRRKNALDHLEAAYENGYNPFAAGCHVIIADGLKGTDEILVPVKGGKILKEAKIGRGVMDADILVSLVHFKVHELVGVGGTIKNVGMGCGSRAGKMEMHSSGKPEINAELCVGCGVCRKNCAHDALTFDENKKMKIDHAKCSGCGRCLGLCRRDAIESTFDEGIDVVGKKIAEYAAAVLRDRPQFHLNFVMDVSPFCDCHNSNDAPIVPNIGIFASTDPVAADKAAADAVNSQDFLPGSILDGIDHSGDYFKDIHPDADWLSILQYGEEIGLGRMEYDMITVK